MCIFGIGWTGAWVDSVLSTEYLSQDGDRVGWTDIVKTGLAVFSSLFSLSVVLIPSSYAPALGSRYRTGVRVCSRFRPLASFCFSFLQLFCKASLYLLSLLLPLFHIPFLQHRHDCSEPRPRPAQDTWQDALRRQRVEKGRGEKKKREKGKKKKKRKASKMTQEWLHWDQKKRNQNQKEYKTPK